MCTSPGFASLSNFSEPTGGTTALPEEYDVNACSMEPINESTDAPSTICLIRSRVTMVGPDIATKEMKKKKKKKKRGSRQR